MTTCSRPLAVTVAIIAAVLAFYPTAGSAATVTVTVGDNCFCFSPASVTIHAGDTVQWIWRSGGYNITYHSSTSGTPGAPNGLWDSGLLEPGSVFTHTFNTAGTFHYYCSAHGQCCGMTGVVTVTNSMPTPTPTPSLTGPPVVTTNPATSVASLSATLDGSLDPHGLATTFHFQYGRTTSYGLTAAPQTQTGNTSRNVSANISSLTANTTYHFRIVASNVDGTRMGADRTFTTLTATGPPVVITNPASNETASSATLHGSLDPHGLTTTVHFQYGTTTSYGHNSAMQTQTGNTYRNIAANISGLNTHTTYHFRIVATNSGGTRMGSDKTFTTP